MKGKLCGWVGCSTIIPNGYYCCKHQKIADQRKKERQVFTQRGASGEYNDLYRTQRWRKERKAFLDEHPRCCLCGADAKIVDHFIPHHGNLELFWNKDNWQSLCMPCHSAKTFRENNSFGKKR